MDSRTFDELKEWAGTILIVFIVLEVLILLCFRIAAIDDPKTYFLDKNNDKEIVYIIDGVASANGVAWFRSARGLPEGADIGEHGYIIDIDEGVKNFNTRAWIATAVGIPLFLILLGASVFEALKTSVFKAKDEERKKETGKEGSLGSSSLKEVIEKHTGSNIFIILAVTLVAVVFMFYVLPNIAILLGETSANVFNENKTLILTGIGLAVGFVFLSMIFRHRRNMKIIDSEAQIVMYQNKLEVQRQIGLGGGNVRQITNGDDVVDAESEKVE